MSYNLLETVTISNTTTSQVVFDGIPQGGTDLAIHFSTRHTGSSNIMQLRFNGSAAAVYDSMIYYTQNSNAAVSEVATNSGAGIFSFSTAPGGSWVGNRFSSGIIHITDYSKTGIKPIRSESYGSNFGGSTGDFFVTMYAHQSDATAAVGSLTLFVTGGFYVPNTTISLYAIA